MEKKKFVYYEEAKMLVGWLEEFPDYRTQGETLEELQENLKDIYASSRENISRCPPHRRACRRM